MAKRTQGDVAAMLKATETALSKGELGGLPSYVGGCLVDTLDRVLSYHERNGGTKVWCDKCKALRERGHKC